MLRYMNAEKYGLDRIYFGGCFIRGTLYQHYLGRRSHRNSLPGLQGTLPLSLRYPMLYAFGARAPKEQCFLGMKGFCTSRHLFAASWILNRISCFVFCLSGAIGAWLRNIEPPEDVHQEKHSVDGDASRSLTT